MSITKIRIDQWITSDGKPFLNHAEAEMHEKRYLLSEVLEFHLPNKRTEEIDAIIDTMLAAESPFIILTKREGIK